MSRRLQGDLDPYDGAEIDGFMEGGYQPWAVCVHCAMRDGTVELRHYVGYRPFADDEHAVALLCEKCYKHFVEYADRKIPDRGRLTIEQVELSEAFLYCIVLTNIALARRWPPKKP